MRITNNIMALNSHRRLGINQSNRGKAMERLSSGFRINRAGDDAAGLAISEKMRAQIRGFKQAERNAQDGISLMQTAEGALNETHSVLQRMRELAVQSATDTNTAEDRKEIQKEINVLLAEIDNIAHNTEFNTQKLLNGTYGIGAGNEKYFHVGANAGQSLSLGIEEMSAEALTRDDVFSGIQAQSLKVFEYEDGWKCGSGDYGANFYYDREEIKIEATMAGVPHNVNIEVEVIAPTYTVDNDGNPIVDINAPAVHTATWDKETNTVRVQLMQNLVAGLHNGIDTGTFYPWERVENPEAPWQANLSLKDFMKFINKDLIPEGQTSWKSPTLGDGNEYYMSLESDDFVKAERGALHHGRVNMQQAEQWFVYENYEDFVASGIKFVGTHFVVGEVRDDDGNVTHPDIRMEYRGPSNSHDETGHKLDGNGNILLYQNGLEIPYSHYHYHITWDGEGLNSFRMRSGGTGLAILSDSFDHPGASMLTREKADAAITRIDKAIAEVSEERSKLGAMQNRLEHTVANLRLSHENLQAAESRIRDLDMADEIMAFTKNSILEQAATSMLAQANMAPQSILDLLR